MAKNTKNDLIEQVEKLYAQLPDLPLNIRDVLVQITPWIAIIFGVLGIVAGLGVIGVSPLALFGGINTGVTVLASGVATIIASALMVIAFPKLQKLQLGGWELLFWSEAVGMLSSLLLLSVSGILGGLIGFYLLFQIKSHYK